jgi:hypothetical protein
MLVMLVKKRTSEDDELEKHIHYDMHAFCRSSTHWGHLNTPFAHSKKFCF